VSPDRPVVEKNETQEVEITPEMISAGAALLGPWAEFERAYVSERYLAEALYLAMARAAKPARMSKALC
jgi:hypothetical protein